MNRVPHTQPDGGRGWIRPTGNGEYWFQRTYTGGKVGHVLRRPDGVWIGTHDGLVVAREHSGDAAMAAVDRHAGAEPIPPAHVRTAHGFRVGLS